MITVRRQDRTYDPNPNNPQFSEPYLVHIDEKDAKPWEKDIDADKSVDYVLKGFEDPSQTCEDKNGKKAKLITNEYDITPLDLDEEPDQADDFKFEQAQRIARTERVLDEIRAFVPQLRNLKTRSKALCDLRCHRGRTWHWQIFTIERAKDRGDDYSQVLFTKEQMARIEAAYNWCGIYKKGDKRNQY